MDSKFYRLVVFVFVHNLNPKHYHYKTKTNKIISIVCKHKHDKFNK